MFARYAICHMADGYPGGESRILRMKCERRGQAGCGPGAAAGELHHLQALPPPPPLPAHLRPLRVVEDASPCPQECASHSQPAPACAALFAARPGPIPARPSVRAASAPRAVAGRATGSPSCPVVTSARQPRRRRPPSARARAPPARRPGPGCPACCGTGQLVGARPRVAPWMPPGRS